MTPPSTPGSVGPAPIRGSSPGFGGTALALAGLVCGLAAPLTAQADAPGDGSVGVSRSRIQGGPEIWVAEVPGEGPVGITLVIPGGVDEETLQALALGLHSRCPQAGAARGAGPDYETLSLSVPHGGLDDALGCLEAALPRADPSLELDGVDGTGTGGPVDAARPSPDLQAYRTASGVLLSTLYAPAAVPGGSLAAAPGTPAPLVPSHLIVVGPVDRRSVERRVSQLFRANAGARDEDRDASVARGAAGTSQPPVATEVLVLERPGEPLAEVRVGRLVLHGDDPDWAPLVVAREILADRLLGGPWVFAELLRVRGPGAFIAGTRLPVEAVPGALDRLWVELETLRDRLPDPGELRTATSRLAGSFAVATGGAPALADELGRVAALGLGPDAVLGYSERLAALTPDAVRRAARAYLDPASLVIAAAGDPAALSRGLARFGPVRVVTPPPPPSDWPRLSVDGRILRPGVSRYRVRIGGREVGDARREVMRLGEERISFRASASIGDATLRQEMEAALPGLDFIRGSTVRGGTVSGTLRREGDRLVGVGPDGAPVELELPPGTVVSDLLEPTLWASDLDVGSRYRVRVTAPGGAGSDWAAVQVVAREAITVPAGRYETLRVLVTGPEILTLWLESDPPHRTVRLSGANGVVLELMGEGEAGRTP